MSTTLATVLPHADAAHQAPQTFSFSSATYSLYATDLRDPLQLPLDENLANAARDRLTQAVQRGYPHALLVGMVPFDPQGASQLYLSTDVTWQGLPVSTTTAHSEHPTTTTGATENLSTLDHDDPQYRALVAQAIATINQHDTLNKVVLARTQTHAAHPSDIEALTHHFAHRNPTAYVFAAPTPTGTMVGASPELVVRLHDHELHSHPLAGSTPRHANADNDATLRDTLLTSAKDLDEHAFVTTHLREALTPLCTELDVPAQPTVTCTPDLWHLGTWIKGRVRHEFSSLEIALAVHPTPAVCGSPTAAALQYIRDHEATPRGFYGGLVGWMDARGNGEWALVLRCMHVNDTTATCFAGAGVVAHSTPEGELSETATKLRTAIAALHTPTNWSV